MKIAFVGAGNLTAAHAAFLHQKGHQILLSGLPGHLGIIPAVQKNGNQIDVVDGTSFPVEIGSIADALHADYTFVTVPGSGHAAAVDELAKHPELSQAKLIVVPGNLFGLFLSQKVSADRFPQLLAATTTSPYASRVLPGTAKVGVLGTKNQIEIAASQRKDGVLSRLSQTEIMELFSGVFPQPLVAYADLASIFLGCTNAVVHPPAMLWAKDRISNGDKLGFYTDCVPPAVRRILKVDTERVMLVARLGLSTKTCLAFSNAWYGKNASDFATFVTELAAYRTVAAPTSMNHRYLTEDVKQLLVFMREWAETAGSVTTEMDSIIAETGDVLDENLMETGTTLESLGMTGATSEEIIAALNGVRFA
jgi:opine dehydrogenase